MSKSSISRNTDTPEIEISEDSPVGAGIILASRIGYVAKGVVYFVAGILAMKASVGARSSTDEHGSQGAIESIANQWFGETMLVVIVIGLLAYVSWRIFQALYDPDDRGISWKGLAQRAGFLVSAAAYLVLSWEAVDIAWGTYASGDDTKKEWTILLLTFFVGQVIVAAVGLAMLGVGIYHFYRVGSGKYLRGYSKEMTALGRTLIRWCGGVGLVARGLQFSLVGVLIVIGAWTIDHEKAEGVGETMSDLTSSTIGACTLLAFGVGLIAYAVYCMVKARYRRYEL